MRGVNGPADLGEEVQASLEAEALLLAVVDDGPAVDALHHQVRVTILIDAAVEEAGDARIVEAGEDLALGEQPVAQARARVHAEDELDRGLGLVLPVGPPRAVDHAHATLAEDLHQLPGAEPLTETGLGIPAGGGLVDEVGRQLSRRPGQEALRGLGIGQEGQHLGQEPGVVAT